MPETKQYGIIYADPPWHYDRKHGSGVAENHYPTMSIEEICALPVSELAAKDSALFLLSLIHISFGVQSRNSQSFASIVKSILVTLFLQ